MKINYLLLISGLTLLIIDIILIYLNIYDSKKIDYFRPDIIVLIFSLISIPGMLFASFGDNYVVQSLRNMPKVRDVNFALGQVGTLSIATLFATILGLKSGFIFKRIFNFYLFRNKILLYVPAQSLVTGVILFLGGIVIYLIILDKIGGLQLIWYSSLYSHVQLTEGLGYFLILKKNILIVGLTFLGYYYSKTKYQRHLILWLIFTLIAFLVEISFGTRNNGGFIIFLFLLIYHYWIKPINLFSIKILALFLIFSIFFLVWGTLRNYKNPLDKLKDPITTVYDSFEYFEGGFLYRIAGLETKALIVSYFNISNIWLGLSYKDLITAPIPKSIYPDKPPIDDGRYLIQIMHGYDIRPSVPLDEMAKTSMPPGNWIGYMNFHIPGLLFYYYISGIILTLFYISFLKNKKKPGWLIIYGSLMYRGGPSLSVQGIVNLFAILITIFVLFIIVKVIDQIINLIFGKSIINKNDIENIMKKRTPIFKNRSSMIRGNFSYRENKM